jgi:hypothetical protein
MADNVITTPTAPVGYTKLVDLQYNTEGQVTDIKTQEVDHSKANVDYSLMEYIPIYNLKQVHVNGHTYNVKLQEALLTNPDAANILRQDIRKLAFDAFNANPRTFGGFTEIMPSNMPEEEYLRDAAIGVIPRAPSGSPAPEMKSDFEGGIEVPNNLYRFIVKILGDWIRFDKIGKIRQVAQEMGLSGRMTEEYEVYSVITTAGNFTRNSTTNDNDVGANTAAATFNADTLRTALDTIATSKDRKSGAYLGYSADTLICGPQLLVPALQLLRSGELSRTHGSTTVEAIGTGTTNPFVGMVSKIVVSPWFGASFQWALCDSRRNTLKYQSVESFNVFQQTQNVTSESWLHLDVLEYLIRGYFGVGLVDDRAWYYSSSTTDATVS